MEALRSNMKEAFVIRLEPFFTNRTYNRNKDGFDLGSNQNISLIKESNHSSRVLTDAGEQADSGVDARAGGGFGAAAGKRTGAGRAEQQDEEAGDRRGSAGRQGTARLPLYTLLGVCLENAWESISQVIQPYRIWLSEVVPDDPKILKC